MITKKQKQVLDFIKEYKAKKKFSPSLEEIKKRFKLASVSTADFHVGKLESLGFLKRQYNKPRSIEIVEKEKMVNIPLLGLIAAGQPIEAIKDKETIVVPQNKLPNFGKFYALRVIGNSMIDENIHDGDIVLVKQQSVAAIASATSSGSGNSDRDSKVWIVLCICIFVALPLPVIDFFILVAAKLLTSMPASAHLCSITPLACPINIEVLGC